MPPERARRGVLLACALLAGLGWVLLRAQAPPSGPVDVPWDRAACSRCRMLLSDPRFAGQLHTESGTVLFFDDPGCLLLAAEGQEFAAAYFHHHDEDAWIPWDRVAFVETAPTPMGYGLAAVRKDRDGAMDVAAAARHAHERERARTGGAP